MSFQITIRDAHHDTPDRTVGNFASYDRAYQWGRSEYPGDHWIRIIEQEAPQICNWTPDWEASEWETPSTLPCMKALGHDGDHINMYGRKVGEAIKILRFVDENPEEEPPARVTIDPTTIVKVYSGRPGCGCGCRGKYWDDARNIARVVKRMNESGDVKVNELTLTPDGKVYFVETESRYLWAYTAD